MPRVLLLSTTTGYQLRSFNDAAERLGVELVFATDRCHQLDDPWRDRAIAVRFHEEEQSLEIIAAEAQRKPFDGILTVGDRPTVLAARVSQRLSLNGNKPDAAAASGNKLETRMRYGRAGLLVPWYFTLPVRTPGIRAAEDPRIQYPCVLKPIGLSGSRGVIRANTPEEFAAAFDRISALLERVDVRAARTGLEDIILVEAFIPGREFAIEGVLTAGNLQIFAIFDKPDPLDGPYFEETIYVTPTSLGAATHARVVSAVEHAVRAVGLSYGPIHAECRVGPEGIYLLEVAPRPIGGLCSRALRFEDPSTSLRAGGVSLEEVLMRHALGDDVSGWMREDAASAVMMVPIPKRGILKRTDGEALARAVPLVVDVVITAKPDQMLEPLPEAGSYLGFIFARGDAAGAVERAVRDAHQRLSFKIETSIDVVAL